MKVGILTFPNSTSFGAALQMYALYRAVEEIGAQAEIINYFSAYMKAERHTGRQQSGSQLKRRLRLWGRKLMHAKQFSGFRAFEASMARYPQKPVTDKAALPTLSARCSHVICGSDQVWNPHITDTDLSYFLDFCGENTKRVAYAPSFGISEFSEPFKAAIKQELLRFDSLSVREPEGQTMLEQLLDRPVQIVCDPTFLLTKEQWSAEARPCPKEKQPYILYYTVKSSKTLLPFALKLAEEMNTKVLVVGGNAVKQLKNKNPRLEYAYDLEPRQWLSLVKNAQCVVTNSFHGTAFSLIFQKEFYLEQSSDTNSRLRQIIQLAGLPERVVGEGCAPWDAHIDYAAVAARFAPLIAGSKEYLKAAVTDA